MWLRRPCAIEFLQVPQTWGGTGGEPLKGSAVSSTERPTQGGEFSSPLADLGGDATVRSANSPFPKGMSAHMRASPLSRLRFTASPQ